MLTLAENCFCSLELFCLFLQSFKNLKGSNSHIGRKIDPKNEPNFRFNNNCIHLRPWQLSRDMSYPIAHEHIIFMLTQNPRKSMLTFFPALFCRWSEAIFPWSPKTPRTWRESLQPTRPAVDTTSRYLSSARKASSTFGTRQGHPQLAWSRSDLYPNLYLSYIHSFLVRKQGFS